MNAKKGPKGKLKITQPHLPLSSSYHSPHSTHFHTHTHTRFLFLINNSSSSKSNGFLDFIFQKSLSSFRWLLDGHIVYHLFPYNFPKTNPKVWTKNLWFLKGSINMNIYKCACVCVWRVIIIQKNYCLIMTLKVLGGRAMCVCVYVVPLLFF